MSFDYSGKPKETKTPSERSTEQVYGRAFWTTYVSFFCLCFGLPLWLGFKPDALIVVGLLWVCEINSKAIATWNCRRAGVSREESRQEIIERSAGAALAPFLSEAPEFDLGRAKRPRTRVDRDSISGYSSGSKWMRIEWRDVGSCIVTTRRDVFGNPSYCHIRLEGHQKFHTIFQSQLSHADAEKLLPAIRFYLRGDESAPQVLGGAS